MKQKIIIGKGNMLVTLTPAINSPALQTIFVIDGALQINEVSGSKPLDQWSVQTTTNDKSRHYFTKTHYTIKTEYKQG